MNSIEATVRPSRKAAIVFGAGSLSLLGAVGVLLIWRKHQLVAGSAFAGVGVALFLLSLAAPTAALAIRGAWMRGAGCVGWVNTRLLLGLFFFLVFTPIALVRRALGGAEAWRWRPGKGAGYWHAREELDPRHLEHPY